MPPRRRFRWMAALIALAAPLASGQSVSGGGSIVGTVKDQTGAVIANATVRAVNTETGVAHTMLTNAGGYFSTATLIIGKYRVHVEAPGMKAWEGDLMLETGRTVEIDPVLTPGAVTETVTVSETIPLVTTTDATDGGTLDARRISELPINGRNMLNLLEDVIPGVEQEFGVNGGVRAGGLLTYSTDYVQDGAAANNRETGGSANLQGLESVGEVRVETSSSSARYSRPTSVLVTTKSGTNRIHGGLYETVRNNAFGVARARQDVNLDGRPYATPKLIRNEFGGSIGGPVRLPTFGWNGRRTYDGRNRTFFFLSREGLYLRQGLTRSYSAPTAAMRAGDFSDLYDSAGRFIPIYDPLTTARVAASNGRVVATRQPFIGNRIPADRESPLAKFVYGITPLPTDITNPLVTSNLKVVVPNGSNPNMEYNPTTARVDHRFGDRDNAFVKVNGGKRNAYFAGNASNGPPTAHYEANTTYVPVWSIGASLSWNHLFSSRFFVETSASRTWQNSKTVTGPVDKDWSAELGLPNPLHELGWPNITNVGSGFVTYTEGDNRRYLRSQINNVEQNYSLIRRTHNLQFGWRYHLEKQTLLPDQGAISGSVSFNSLATALESSTTGSAANPAATPQTGFDAANFFLGYAGTYSVALKRGIMRLADRNYGLYLQDNYKVNGRLTLNLGLRWDMNPAFQERNYLLNSFDVPSHSIMLAQPLDYYYRIGASSPAVVALYEKVGVKFSSAAELGKSDRIFQSNWFDLGPRAGFAYRVLNGRRQFIVRGGYGIYISPIAMRNLLAAFSGMPPFRADYSRNFSSAAQSPDGIANYLLRNAPAAVAGVNTANIVDTSSPNAVGRGQSVYGVGPLPSMRIHEWNLAVEKQLGATTVVRIRYNGKHGVNAEQFMDLNEVPSNYVWYVTRGVPTPTGEFASVARRPYDQTAYTSVRILQKSGYINSTIWVGEIERRWREGLAFQAFYTLTNVARLAGNWTRDGIGVPPDNYLPGSLPADPDAANRFLNYRRDPAIPKHRVRWNWTYDLPFGRGARIYRSAPKAIHAVIGGWRFSGSGTIASTWFAMPTNNWGAFTQFEAYGTKYPILDCRGTPANATRPQDERCIPGYLWFNGYISERNIETRNAAGLRTGVFGLPADYHPAQRPVNPWPEGGKTSDPGAADYDTNSVYIRLKDGSLQRVALDTGLHPWRNQYRLGPFNWISDASMMKFFSIRERLRLRVNVDVFNVFNTQGLNVPNSEGIVSRGSSFGGFGFRPRQMQLTMRLEW